LAYDSNGESACQTQLGHVNAASEREGSNMTTNEVPEYKYIYKVTHTFLVRSTVEIPNEVFMYDNLICEAANELEAIIYGNFYMENQTRVEVNPANIKTEQTENADWSLF
jgi:hypothetical protein